MNKNYIEGSDFLFAQQLRNFYKKLDSYSTLLGITSEELDEAKNDSIFWDYLIDADKQIEMFAKDFKKTKNLAKLGNKNEILSAIPSFPNLRTPPSLVPANIKLRFRQKAGKAKSSPNYNKAIGVDLGILAVQQIFTPFLGKPVLKIKMNVGHPIVSYTKKKYQGINIYKNVGEGYAYLGIALTSKFEDDSSLPQPGRSAVWKYKAIYVWKGKETGEWSDEITVAVVR